jgi:formate/nitrite transporter FocA (FNT family)
LPKKAGIDVQDSPIELFWSGVIALVLVGLGVYYWLREGGEWRRQIGYENLPPADRRHFRCQFYRRRVGAALLTVIGLVIAVSQGVVDWHATPRVYAWLWIGVMVGLMAVVALAGVDLVAIRRFARRQQQRINEDRQAMLARQLDQMRTEPRPPYWPNPDVERN